MIKQLYKDYLTNRHCKPILWGDTDFELKKQIKQEEAACGKSKEELDAIFEEAKQEVMREVGHPLAKYN